MPVGSSAATTTFTQKSDRELEVTRWFDAPRELVWEAMTKPEHVRNWWGPRGTSLTVCEIDRPARVVNTEHYDVPELRDHPAMVTMQSGMEGGWRETLDRLNELVVTL